MSYELKLERAKKNNSLNFEFFGKRNRTDWEMESIFMKTKIYDQLGRMLEIIFLMENILLIASFGFGLIVSHEM